jgi:hypothetical protein
VHFAIDDGRASLRVHARWMGQVELDVTLEGEHRILGSHSGALLIEQALMRRDSLQVPESDGPLIIEYVRIPPQAAPLPGSESLPFSGGRWTDPYSLVLWLHPDAYCHELHDDRDDAVHPKRFRPVVDALRWLERPWKLGPA